MPNLTAKQWAYVVVGVVALDMLVGGIILYIFVIPHKLGPEAVLAAERPTPRPTMTPTLWAGPPPRPTVTATLPPTSQATDVLAQSGFPPGFTPTPRPTRESFAITLPYVFTGGRSKLDMPVINQVHYPEPFFPPGTNNACGPVALFAGLLGLGLEVDYGHLRDTAVNHGFTSYGISKQGMVDTISTLNYEWGNSLQIEHGNRYRTKDLIKHLRQGAVVAVLVRVKRENGRYRVTTDPHNSVGHFLLVERVNLFTRKVTFAGSTLGMEEVPLGDFIQSWANNPDSITAEGGWRSYFRKEPAQNWAIIIKRS